MDSNGRIHTKTIISVAVLCIAAAGIGFYLKQNPGSVSVLWRISFWSMITLFLVSIGILAANGLCLRIVVRKFSILLKWREWFGLAAVTAMGNYLTPFSGGLVARAAYLKHRHDFPYASFLAVLASYYMIAFTAVSIVGIAALIAQAGGRGSWPILLLFVVTISAILLILYLPPMAAQKGWRLLRFVQPALEGFEIIRRDKALLMKLIGLTLFNIAAGGGLYFMAFESVGFSVSYGVALLVYLLTSFTLLITITPGNLGVQEAAASLAAGILGAGADVGLLAALIVRAAAVFTAFTMGPIFSYLLSRELIKDRARTRSIESIYSRDP